MSIAAFEPGDYGTSEMACKCGNMKDRLVTESGFEVFWCTSCDSLHHMTCGCCRPSTPMKPQINEN